jgi:uncharacterized protein YggE
MKRFLIPAVLTLLAGSTLAQTTMTTAPREGMAETISVTGTGHASVVPDRVTFTLGVQSVAPTVDEAVNDNNRRTADAIAALKKAGATDKEIRTSNFSIFPQQDYREGKLPRILGYQVSNNITVSREKVADAGRLLQVAVNAGVNTSSGLQFEVSDPAKGRDQGLRSAFEEARAKAGALAQAAGRSLGRPLSITEGAAVTPPQPYPMQRMAKMEAVSEVPIEAGVQEMAFTVSVVFELR